MTDFDLTPAGLRKLAQECVTPDTSAFAVLLQCSRTLRALAAKMAVRIAELESELAELKATPTRGDDEMEITDEMIDRGAKWLRGNAGYSVEVWDTLPNSTKRKWRKQAEGVLRAATQTHITAPHIEE